LKARLFQKRAKETGICPIREETYAQVFGAQACFNANVVVFMIAVQCDMFKNVFFPKVKADRTSLDELIRQCTVESPERGLLLLRVRDEMRIIVAAYQVLYESSLAYAVRKGLHAEVQRLEAQLLVSLRLNALLTLTIDHHTDFIRQLQAKKLESDKRDIERQLQELQVRAETIARRESEKWAAMESRQKAEMRVLRDISRDCKSKLMDALAPPKWE
jgi:dynein light intermediate chain